MPSFFKSINVNSLKENESLFLNDYINKQKKNFRTIIIQNTTKISFLSFFLSFCLSFMVLSSVV